MNKKAKTPLTNSKFGRMGWTLVIFYFLILMLNATFTADGPQILIPQLAGETGLNQATMLTWNTIAGYFALVAYIPIGIWASKKGARKQASILTIITGIAFLLLGYSNNLAMYAIFLCLANIGINGAGWISCAKLTSNWFPRKKGIVMGWTTIGNNVCTVLCVPLLSIFVALGGTKTATTIFGIVTIVVGVLAAFLLKETPEECGLYPDNITPEQEKEYGIAPADTVNADGDTGRFTVGGILKCKEFWIISLTMAFGMCGGIAAVAFATVRMQEFGFSQATAVSINSGLALFACLGSVVWGWIDQKTSTKKAMLAFFVMQIVAVICNVGAAQLDHNVPLMIVSNFLFYWCLGGAANWPVSISATLFERSDFIKAQTPFTVIFTAGRCSGFAVIALGMRMTHGAMDGAYILSAVMNLIAFIILATLNVPKFKAKYYS
ncbi:MAG: nitrate/nitrite transporter [Agathobacter sp.]